jgi:hypothetical protein
MGRIPHWFVYTPVVALADLSLIQGSFVATLLIKHGYTGIPSLYLAGYAPIVPSICLLSLVILHLFNQFYWSQVGRCRVMVIRLFRDAGYLDRAQNYTGRVPSRTGRRNQSAFSFPSHGGRTVN